MRVPVYLLVTVLGLSAPCAAADITNSSLRCGTRLVQVGDPCVKVLNLCAEPNVKTRESGTSELKIEKWVYGPIGGYQYTLTFWDDVLKKIEGWRF
jgi:hypothetical protein